MDMESTFGYLLEHWPYVLTAIVAIFLGALGVAEAGIGPKIARMVPGTKTYGEYRFFKGHGYWPPAGRVNDDWHAIHDDDLGL